MRISLRWVIPRNEPAVIVSVQGSHEDEKAIDSIVINRESDSNQMNERQSLFEQLEKVKMLIELGIHSCSK
jgi:hypothetical protein